MKNEIRFGNKATKGEMIMEACVICYKRFMPGKLVREHNFVYRYSDGSYEILHREGGYLCSIECAVKFLNEITSDMDSLNTEDIDFINKVSIELLTDLKESLTD